MADLGKAEVVSVLSQIGTNHAAGAADEEAQSTMREEPVTNNNNVVEETPVQGNPPTASGEATAVAKSDTPFTLPTEGASAVTTATKEVDSANKSHVKKRPKAQKMGAKRQKRDDRWWTLYESLKKYHAAHGTSDVPKNWEEQPALSRWCQEQRKEYQLYQDWFRNQNSPATTTTSKVAFTCALDLPKIQLLNALGFRWDPDQEEWNHYYQELQQFIATHGPSTTPKLKKTHPKLANWLNTQHRQMTFKARGEKSRLDDDKYNKLKALGWNFRQLVNWDDRFKELQDYYQKHGHFEAAGIATENADLASWVTVQRKQYAKFQEQKKSSMTPERIDKLNSINFPWRMKETGKDWMERYRELNEYRVANGDCRVPKRYPPSTGLGWFVRKQRRDYKLFHRGQKSSMTQEKIVLLEQIGFEWSLREQGPTKRWPQKNQVESDDENEVAYESDQDDEETLARAMEEAQREADRAAQAAQIAAVAAQRAAAEAQKRAAQARRKQEKLRILGSKKIASPPVVGANQQESSPMVTEDHQARIATYEM